MIRKFFMIVSILLLSLTMSACNEDGDLEEDFDPTPYLAAAYQKLTNYEEVMVQPKTAKWVYVDEPDGELSVLFLFTSFGRTGEADTFYAMITIYLNKTTESLVDSFIDRIYYDELKADLSSLQGYNTLYSSILEQMKSVEANIVETGDLKLQDLQTAIGSVTAP